MWYTQFHKPSQYHHEWVVLTIPNCPIYCQLIVHGCGCGWRDSPGQRIIIVQLNFWVYVDERERNIMYIKYIYI
jgi:hypothetical protein